MEQAGPMDDSGDDGKKAEVGLEESRGKTVAVDRGVTPACA